jgi:hypothetical protein
MEMTLIKAKALSDDQCYMGDEIKRLLQASGLSLTDVGQLLQFMFVDLVVTGGVSKKDYMFLMEDTYDSLMEDRLKEAQ